MLGMLEHVGAFTLHIFEKVGVLALLFLQTVRQLPKIQRRLTIAQMAHLGVNSLPIVSLTLLFAGMVMTLQIVDILLRYGAQSTLGGIMSIAMGRELGPILTGVVVAGRVGAAMTAEIGTMKVTEQIDALRCPLVNAEEQRHHQQKQRPAANAPCGDNGGAQSAEKGKNKGAHSRYLTPA